MRSGRRAEPGDATSRHRSGHLARFGRPGRVAVRVLLLGLSAAAAGCAVSGGAGAEERRPETAGSSFAVYALSRGQGVPGPTRTALEAIWSVLESARRDGTVARLERTRIGLEGEVRLCAELGRSAAAREVLERVRALARDVELLNLVEEPCPAR